MAKIGQRIKELREKAGLSQREVAEGCGVTTPLVSRWENHTRWPTIENLEKIARLVGVEYAELLSGVDDFGFRIEDPEMIWVVQTFAGFSPFFKHKFLEFAEHFARMAAEAEPKHKPVVPQPAPAP